MDGDIPIHLFTGLGLAEEWTLSAGEWLLDAEGERALSSSWERRSEEEKHEQHIQHNKIIDTTQQHDKAGLEIKNEV